MCLRASRKCVRKNHSRLSACRDLGYQAPRCNLSQGCEAYSTKTASLIGEPLGSEE